MVMMCVAWLMRLQCDVGAGMGIAQGGCAGFCRLSTTIVVL